MATNNDRWNGRERRDKNTEEEWMAMLNARFDDDRRWREGMDKKLACLQESWNKHEPTLTSITKSCEYWSKMRDEVVRGLIKGGIFSAAVAILVALWYQFKINIKL